MAINQKKSSGCLKYIVYSLGSISLLGISLGFGMYYDIQQNKPKISQKETIDGYQITETKRGERIASRLFYHDNVRDIDTLILNNGIENAVTYVDIGSDGDVDVIIPKIGEPYKRDKDIYVGPYLDLFKKADQDYAKNKEEMFKVEY